jgi:hypothetical protein
LQETNKSYEKSKVKAILLVIKNRAQKEHRGQDAKIKHVGHLSANIKHVGHLRANIKHVRHLRYDEKVKNK